MKNLSRILSRRDSQNPRKVPNSHQSYSLNLRLAPTTRSLQSPKHSQNVQAQRHKWTQPRKQQSPIISLSWMYTWEDAAFTLS